VSEVCQGHGSAECIRETKEKKKQTRTIGGGSAVFKVTLAFGFGIPTNPNRGTAVGHSVGELVNRSRLELPRQTELVPFTINLDVLRMLGAQLVHGLLDNLETALFAHGLGGHVGVHTW
jgi:hypothetical protein